MTANKTAQIERGRDMEDLLATIYTSAALSVAAATVTESGVAF